MGTEYDLCDYCKHHIWDVTRGVEWCYCGYGVGDKDLMDEMSCNHAQFCIHQGRAPDEAGKCPHYNEGRLT